jgi:Kef-type K+ transport system membrane component KefB
VPSTTRWWKSPRFWFFALPFATGGLASWVPPLWVASKVHEGQLKARLYLAAAAAAVLAAIGGVLVGSAPEDAMGSASGPRADVGTLVLLVAIGIGTGTAVLFRHRVFPDDRAPADAGTLGGSTLLPGVQEAQARRQRRTQYRSLADGDAALAREMHLGRPDRTPAFDDGGLVDLNALDAAGLQRHAHVTAAEAASIISTRDKLGRLSSVDELVVHGDLTLTTAERLRDYAVFIG